MISRRTAHALAELFADLFCHAVPDRRGARKRVVDTKALYDFLYDHNYEPWFCNKAREITSYSDMRPLLDFIMKLHTGETQYDATPNWSWETRQRLGQRYLLTLARDVLNDLDAVQYSPKDAVPSAKQLLSYLELDGYRYDNKHLLAPEEDVLDAQEESGILESLYTALRLQNKETALHHLGLSEEHYLAGRWDDSIANSRKVLECILQEVAATHSVRMQGIRLSEDTYTRPVRVREYLEKEGLLETKEKEAVAAVYGLLSHTGGHPYMAENEQARLLRHLALTFSQFVMLRLQGSLAQ